MVGVVVLVAGTAVASNACVASAVFARVGVGNAVAGVARLLSKPARDGVLADGRSQATTSPNSSVNRSVSLMPRCHMA